LSVHDRPGAIFGWVELDCGGRCSFDHRNFNRGIRVTGAIVACSRPSFSLFDRDAAFRKALYSRWQFVGEVLAVDRALDIHGYCVTCCWFMRHHRELIEISAKCIDSVHVKIAICEPTKYLFRGVWDGNRFLKSHVLPLSCSRAVDI